MSGIEFTICLLIVVIGLSLAIYFQIKTLMRGEPFWFMLFTLMSIVVIFYGYSLIQVYL